MSPQQQTPVYLDDNGNPIGGSPSSSKFPASPVYLDNSGNPITPKSSASDPNAIPTGPIDISDPNARNAAPIPTPPANAPSSAFDPNTASGPLGTAVGVGKGMAETGEGILNLVGKVAGVKDAGTKAFENPLPGSGIDLTGKGATTAQNTAQDIGKISENIMEFLAGDEALKGLSLAEKFGIASKIAKTAETSPNIAKALRIGMDSLRQGSVASGETLAKGGTPTQALEAGAGTAAGSEFLGTLGQGAGALYGVLKKATPEAIAAAKQAAADQGTALASEIANAPVGSPVENARAVSDQLQKSEDQMHAEYAQGLAQLTQEAANIQVPIAGSAAQNTAKDLLTNSSLPESLQEAVKGVVPDSSKLDPLLTKLSDPKAVYTWPEMQGLYQSVGQTIRKLPYDSPVRTDLIHLRASINQTMIDAAEKSGNEDVSNAMKSMRDVYATKVSAFDTSAIKALKDKNPDAVADILLRKGSVVNINNLRSLIGDENMKPVEGQLLKKLIDDSSTSGVSKAGASVEGEFNPGVFVQKFNKLGPDVQSAIWGDNLPQVKQFLQVAAKVKTDSPLWGGMAKYMEHRAIYGVGVGVLGFGGTYSVTHSVKDAAIVTAALLTLQNPTWLKIASKVLGGAAEPAEAIKGGVSKVASKFAEGAEEPSMSSVPAATPAIPTKSSVTTSPSSPARPSVTPINEGLSDALAELRRERGVLTPEQESRENELQTQLQKQGEMARAKARTQEAVRPYKGKIEANPKSITPQNPNSGAAPLASAPSIPWDGDGKIGDFPGKAMGGHLSKIQKVDLDKIQPTETPDPETVESLKHQFLTDESQRPIPAIVVEDNGDGTYSVIDGHNRLAAAKSVGYKQAPIRIYTAPEDIAATPKSSIQPIPAALKGNAKIPDESIIGHEYGHGASAIASGGKLEELRSNWHPQNMVDNAAASARVTWPAEGAKSPDEWLSKPDNMMNFVQNYLAGGVTQKVLDGIKPEENPGLVGDIASVKETLNKVGITDPKQQQDVIEYLQKDWENKLTTPNPKTGRTLGDIIREYRQEREDGLPEERLASLRKIRDFTKEVQQHVHNAGSK